MKKLMCTLLALMLLFSSTVVLAKNSKENGNNGIGNLKKINYYNDESASILINGIVYLMNDGNIIRYKNFQLPTKPITEGLGAEVDWNVKTHIITITDGNITLVMNLDTKIIKVNGFEIKSSVLTATNKNKNIVLIRFIAQVLGKNAQIDEGTGVVIIDDDGSTSINDNIKGNGINQFEYTGNWNYGTEADAYLEDNHWSSSSNAYYRVRFNGTQIKLYGATSENHGIAAVSIDNGRETNVDFYSAKRADNVLLYTSPVLTQGQHTIKVRVTGNKNRNSKGTNITADRVNIYSNNTSQDYYNIALDKSSFSDSQQPENTAYNGNDGNRSTRWCAADGSINHWWTVDLGALYNISGSEVTWEKPNKVYKYKIEVSADNSHWTLKVNKTNNTSTQQVQRDKFNANSVRFVKITVTGMESSSWASFSEFKVFEKSTGTSNDNNSPTAPDTLKATAPVPNEVALNWNASYDDTGVSGYKIYRNGYEVANVTSGTSYRDRGLTAGTAYAYSIVAYDAAGNYSNQSEYVYVTTPYSNDIGYGNGNGLKGEYYNNKDLTDLKFLRIDDTVNEYWNNNSPDSKINNETFSIRWTGQVQPLYSEEYTFYTVSDDGVRLWVNGVMLIDNWNDHSETENSGTIYLTAGQKYNIKLEYYNNSQEGKIDLEWSSYSQVKEIVPNSQLYTAAADTQSPTVPEQLRASAVSSNRIYLSWNASSDNIGVVGYRIYRKGVLAGTVKGTTNFTDTGLSANKTYSYTVVAFDAAGNTSGQSRPVTAATEYNRAINYKH